MTKQINSKMMKRAVTQLFNYEINKNSKCSSHSEIERWIIEELKNFPSFSADALKKILKVARDLDFDIDNDNDDTVDDGYEYLENRYMDHGLHKYDVARGVIAFRYSTDDESYYILVGAQDEFNTLTNMRDAVTIGLYNDDDEMLFSKDYDNSYRMLLDGHIIYLLGL